MNNYKNNGSAANASQKNCRCNHQNGAQSCPCCSNMKRDNSQERMEKECSPKGECKK